MHNVFCGIYLLTCGTSLTDCDNTTICTLELISALQVCFAWPLCDGTEPKALNRKK